MGLSEFVEPSIYISRLICIISRGGVGSEEICIVPDYVDSNHLGFRMQ